MVILISYAKITLCVPSAFWFFMKEIINNFYFLLICCLGGKYVIVWIFFFTYNYFRKVNKLMHQICRKYKYFFWKSHW